LEEANNRSFDAGIHGSNEQNEIDPSKLAPQIRSGDTCFAKLGGAPRVPHTMLPHAPDGVSLTPVSCTQYPSGSLDDELDPESEAAALSALQKCMARVADLSTENRLLKYRLARNQA
jgi:hypothetical protein